MDLTSTKTSVSIILIVSLLLSLCGCCGENHNNGGNRLELSSIYGAALGGALIGGIIGHQSDETGEGVAIGAAVLGVGEFLRQADNLARKEHREHEGESAEPVVIEIHNSNGSVTPVKIKKENSHYIGPKGERYEDLPTEEQLKPIYGL